MKLPLSSCSVVKSWRPSLLPLLVAVVALTSIFPGGPVFAQNNEIKTIPLTVVTVAVPQTQQNPSGLEQKLVQINDSGKQPINTQINSNPVVLELPNSLTNQSLKVNTALGYGQAIDPTYLFAGKTGAPVCGGFWNGKLQAPCPPSPATFVAEAVGVCPAGSFPDLGAASCWACPDGYTRTADSLTGATACAKADPSVPLKRMSAKFVSSQCPAGSFFDPIRGGECYSCPNGYKRSAAHIDAANACYVPAGEQLTKATRIKNTPWPHECSAGTFHDAWNGGACWRCPAGSNRTGNHISSGQACSQAVPEQQAKATPRGAAQCKTGEFLDPRNGGECWSCPAATYRTVFPVTGGEACEQRPGFRVDKATQVSAFSCPAGSFLDLINSRDSNVRSRIQKQIAETGQQVSYGTSAGGTCWSCPPGYDRDIYHVASDAACTTRSIKWQPAPYVQPGLLGLDGSNEVAQELLKDKRLIESLIAAMAADLNKPLAQARKDAYDEIATRPQMSIILAVAMYKRIEAAVLNPAQASPAEKRLVASFAEAIRQYKIFIAQNALDAYDQWVEARGRRLSADAEKAGSASLEQMRLNQVAFKGGEVPPEFTEIVSEMIALNVLAPAAAQAMLSTTQATPRLRNLIWSSRKAGDIIRKMAQKPTEQAAEKVVKKGVEKFLGTMKKALTKSSEELFSVAMKAGPQILVDVAIEMIVGTVEHFEAVLNARPKLVTNLAGAKEPVDLLREFNADNDWLYQQWATSLGKGDQQPGNLGTFAALAKTALEQAGADAASTAATTTGQGWRQLPGAALDIGAGPNGLWVIGTQAVEGGYEIFRMFGSNWGKVPGGGVRIDVDPSGNAWITTDKGTIFRYTGNGWAAVPGLAKDIGVGPTGVWVIGVGAVQGGYSVYRWANNAWQDMKSGGVRIDVDPQGNAWIVNDKGDVFRYTGSAWAAVPGIKARDVGIGADGSVFATATDGGVHKWSGSAWIKRDGGLAEITVDANGIPFGVNGAKQVWVGYR